MRLQLQRQSTNKIVTHHYSTVGTTIYPMSLEKDTCFFCNGYYGPTHGEYVCSTCHIFLYADERNLNITSSTGVLDENDSGNDEPSEGQLSNERCNRTPCVHNQASSLPRNGIQRSLLERVKELSATTNERVKTVEVDHMAKLPPEVFFIIFRHLDSLSLWTLSVACSYLTDLIHVDTSEDKWREQVQRYWPLYKSLYDESWYSKFSKLVLSAPCKTCLRKMMTDIENKTSINVKEVDCIDNSRRLRRLRHDMNTMKNDPPEGVNATPIDENLIHWSASIQGPANSPYEGGVFFLYMQFPYVYPLHPPKIRFITRIFHPNISRHGDLGLDCIAHNWSLALTIAKILISIQSLLTDPYCKVCMEPSIAELYERDRDEFNRKATQWTYKYAMNDILPVSVHESDHL